MSEDGIKKIEARGNNNIDTERVKIKTARGDRTREKVQTEMEAHSNRE